MQVASLAYLNGMLHQFLVSASERYPLKLYILGRSFGLASRFLLRSIQNLGSGTNEADREWDRSTPFGPTSRPSTDDPWTACASSSPPWRARTARTSSAKSLLASRGLRPIDCVTINLYHYRSLGTAVSLSPIVPISTSRLLIVEAHPDFAKVVTLMLQNAGRPWNISRTEHVAGALDRLAAGGIEAVLLDLRLPDATGFDAVDRVVAAFPDVPIVVMTSYDRTLAAEALQRGAQDYIVKSEVNPELLSRSLSYAVSRKRAKLALRRSDARFRAAVEGSLDAVGILSAVRDESGRVADFVVAEVNANAARLIGRPREQIVSRRLTELWPDQPLRPFLERSVWSWRRARPSKKRSESRCPACPADGSTTRSCPWKTESPSPPATPPPATRPRRTSAGARSSCASRRRWRRSAGWPAASRTTSTTCSPSSAGTASCPAASSPSDHPLRRNLEEIGLAAERAAALTRQLLAFSRKQVLEPRTLRPQRGRGAA